MPVKRKRSSRQKRKDFSAYDLHKLLHELQVHSEEITAQNEQLIKAQRELELARDRYADLYDFAPIGYVSLDVRGNIADINRAGAALLGRPRQYLLDLPFARTITAADYPAFRKYLALNRSEGGVGVVEVQPRAEPRRTIKLMSRSVVLSAGDNRLLVAMIDSTDARRIEAEREEALRREQERAAELGVEIAARRESEARVKALLNRLVTAQEEERRRIARNLHDHLGQQLTALRLTIDALKQERLSKEDSAKRLDLIDRLASQIDRDVDLLAWDLRPAELDDAGLTAAIETLLRQWAVAQNITADFHVSAPDALRVSRDRESHLYRIVQEALHNVGKHASARKVSVMIECRDDDLTVIVEDDGRGFRVDEPHTGSGMGLISMQERAALIGGRIDWESAPGQGTTVFVRIPVKALES